MRQSASGLAWAQEQSPTKFCILRGAVPTSLPAAHPTVPLSFSSISCSVISDPVQQLPDPSQLLWTTLHGKEGKWPDLVRASPGTQGSALDSLA